MPTLWQMFKNKFFHKKEPKPKKEDEYPLRAKVGSSVILHTIDLSKIIFFVQEINKISRMVNNQNFPLYDYVLLAKPLNKEQVSVKLRFMPASDGYNIILLSQEDSFPFSQDFRDILNENEFVTQQDGEETGRYWRINDVKGSYCCQTESQQFEYWDYWRDFQDEANQNTTEYLFVEMEKSDGFFSIWKGLEILPNRIDVK